MSKTGIFRKYKNNQIWKVHFRSINPGTKPPPTMHYYFESSGDHFWPLLDSSGGAALVPRMLAKLGLGSDPCPRLLRPNKLPRLKVSPPLGLNWNPNWPRFPPSLPKPPWLKSPSPKLFCPPGLADRHCSYGGVVQACGINQITISNLTIFWLFKILVSPKAQ